ncbi:MAG: sulfatase activating formylglycine-generating enzyme, partial [Candidatus Azotimanducaceae bacterium]
ETGVETALLSEQANRQAEAARLATEQQAADNKARQQAAELARAQAAKDKAQILKDTDFVDIPAGDFMMGSPESEPERGDNERLHWIEVEAFKMLSTPVTFAQYDQYCEMSGAEKPDDEGWGRQKRPMINVSYWDAVDFCTWVTEQTGIKHRLPTEAEWEYACRAGTTTPFWTGQNGTTDQANYRGDYPYNDNPEGIYREKTTLVDHFPVNPWGLHDMHGNVWEWCASVYDEAYQGAETQGPSGDSNDNSPRLLRGGSWLNIGGWLRSASRNCNEPAWRYCNIGFRVVQDTRG